ncbi:hypothetical protein [Granulosicoccus antarcticus]|uniref:hypothetical protein n=1 Tax=Granulosicoccus antarcticus TaxID=437505 RepID=UPI0012FE68F6|nr:hypothetical protein [Granulosicoccus antarcticus]
MKFLDVQARRDHSLSVESAPTDVPSSTSDVDGLVAAFADQFAATAQDPEAFHGLLREAFGDSYDQQAAEVLRQSALEGDFSWLPSIEVVDASELADQSGTQGAGTGMGAYDASNDRILLSKELLNGDAGQALDVLTEEIGHSLDARLNTSDTAGDEGAVFARLSRGDTLGASELAALRAEDDSGIIIVDGEEVAVEYGWLSDRWDDVTGVVDDVVDTVTDVVDSVTDAVSDGIEWVGDTLSDGVQWVGDTIGDGVDFIYENGVRPVLENTGALGEFIDEHVARPMVGAIGDAIDIGTNIVDSVVDTTTHVLSNGVQTFGQLLQGNFSGAWSSAVQTVTDFASDLAGATVETFAMGLHAATSVINGTLGLSGTRSLTGDEVAYLQTIYGDSLDYSEMRIQEGGIESWVGMDPHTVGSDIYLPEAYFVAEGAVDSNGTPIPEGTLTQAGLELLSHEAAHTWQFQNSGAGYLSEAIGSYIVDKDGAYDYISALDNLTPWEDMTPDQQAELAMLIGMAQADDGVGVVTLKGLKAAIDEDRGTGVPAYPVLSVEQFDYVKAIQTRLLAGDA